MKTQYCPRVGCYRSGKNVGQCGNHITPCPAPADADPLTTTTLKVDGKQFTIPNLEIVRKVVGYWPDSDQSKVMTVRVTAATGKGKQVAGSDKDMPDGDAGKS